MQKIDTILRSNAIFTGLEANPSPGFVAIRGSQIAAVGTSDGSELIGNETIVYDLGNQLICPGFVDVHCFFTGYLLTIAGKDLSHCQSSDEVLKEIKIYQQGLKSGATVIARGLKPALIALHSKRLDEEFGDVPVILFTADGDSCCMNTAAKIEYQFTPETCWSESYWRLLKYILNDTEFSVPEFKKYLAMMNSKGITSTKEMGFDDFFGFTDVLKQLETSNDLSVRVNFMSQPVGFPMNLAYGKMMRETFRGNFVRFSGYNQMTDGSISQIEGEMKQPYRCTNTRCKKQIDWESLEKDTLAADKEGFRFSLHAQGDGAISKVVDIFYKCQKTSDGKLLNREAITDLECSDITDLERMGRLGIIAEIYPQIMSIANRKEKLAMIDEKIGMERGKNYWNRRGMADHKVILSCATDLPLLIDDIPESIYHTVGAQFPEGGEPFNKENTLTTAELLKAWTIGGQYNLGCEQILGTLEIGKLADIAVLDADVFKVPMDQIRKVKVSMTLVDGKIVYKNM